MIEVEAHLISYTAGGLVGALGAALTVLLIDGGRKFAPADGWGRYKLLFPKVWVKVWYGYAAMTLVSLFVIPLLLQAAGLSTSSDTSDESLLPPKLQANLGLLAALGPFVHCFLMPFFWARKHLNLKAAKPPADTAAELDPEAKTVVFAQKRSCGDSILIMTVGLLITLVDFVLVLIQKCSVGTIDLRAFWFPMPFYNFWKAKSLLRSIQIDGCLLCTVATQDDAYMKFCTEVMLNFWTLGLYSKCCSGRVSYTRWLDRHIRWCAAQPSGYNNQFRIFDKKLTLAQKCKMFLLWFVIGVLLGGVVSYIPFLRIFWVPALALDFFRFKFKLSNMRFGGSQPYFGPAFTFCNYLYTYYLIGICGFCSMRVKRWVDAQICMGKPFMDSEIENTDAVDPGTASQSAAACHKKVEVFAAGTVVSAGI